MFAGIHLAVVSSIGIATIAATINAGGIGRILLDGLRTLNTTKILWGTLMSAGLAILANELFNIIEKRLVASGNRKFLFILYSNILKKE